MRSASLLLLATLSLACAEPTAITRRSDGRPTSESALYSAQRDVSEVSGPANLSPSLAVAATTCSITANHRTIRGTTAPSGMTSGPCTGWPATVWGNALAGYKLCGFVSWSNGSKVKHPAVNPLRYTVTRPDTVRAVFHPVSVTIAGVC